MDQNLEFFQGNTSSRNSVKTLYSGNKIKTLKIPPKNPNISPIENSWVVMI